MDAARTVTDRPGCAAVTALIIRGSGSTGREGMAASSIRPARSPATASLASASPRTTWCAGSIRAFPASVSTRRRPIRWNRFCPRSRSSAWMACAGEAAPRNGAPARSRARRPRGGSRASIVASLRADQATFGFARTPGWRYRRPSGSVGEHPRDPGTGAGRAFDAEISKDRNTIERGFGRLKQWRAIATRRDNYATTYLGGGLLACLIIHHRVRDQRTLPSPPRRPARAPPWSPRPAPTGSA
ncbi:DDE family transposase [Amycolatopsis sulphurea]|uniref:DDE family transposase n=1 Tax=Amycolatopsis sulphurea TaxID=76022 RepID=A0A2A9FJ61_9PSEU|nr:DDE family transposase [Amycolatopsis sulphurea]